jgi:hypothetical protein
MVYEEKHFWIREPQENYYPSLLYSRSSALTRRQAMRQIHISIGHFPAGDVQESEDGPKIYLMTTSDDPDAGISERLLDDSEEGWRELEETLLETFREFRQRGGE